jgi:hypothetical protein
MLLEMSVSRPSCNPKKQAVASVLMLAKGWCWRGNPREGGRELGEPSRSQSIPPSRRRFSCLNNSCQWLADRDRLVSATGVTPCTNLFVALTMTLFILSKVACTYPSLACSGKTVWTSSGQRMIGKGTRNFLKRWLTAKLSGSPIMLLSDSRAASKR